MFRLLLLFLVLSGCSFNLSSPPEPRRYFVLEELPVSSEGNTLLKIGPESGVLRVKQTRSGGFINSQRVIFSKDNRSRGYYQFAFWVEPPPVMFNRVLLNALDRSGIFSGIVRDNSGVPADYELSTEILDFYHSTIDSPGHVVVSLEAELIDTRNRSVVERRKFRALMEAESFDVEGAVGAFQASFSKLVPELLEWLGEAQLESMKVNL